jgi:hypothetical protein
MQKHYQQRDLAAREWKTKGGKVAGYFCDKVPEEVILKPRGNLKGQVVPFSGKLPPFAGIIGHKAS